VRGDRVTRLSVVEAIGEMVQGAVLSASLLLVAAFGYCADGTWSVNGNTYTCYRASFHVHTRWSGPKEGEHNYKDDALKWGWDHRTCPEPDDVLRRARGLGYDVIGFSDHDRQIDPWEWGILGWEPGRTILGCAGVTRYPLLVPPLLGAGNPPSATDQPAELGIAGFEWTPGGDVGHVNVFYPADHAARDVSGSTARKIGQYPVLYAERDLWGVDRFNERNETFWFAYSCATLEALYQRLDKVAQAYPGSEPIAQFNHPAARNPASGKLVYGGHFNNFRFDETASQYFRLFEMAYTWASNCDFEDGEPLYGDALRKGWRLAPSIGMDNGDEDLPSPAEGHTAVWASSLTVDSVLEAIRSCRVFATQVPDLSLQFTATVDGRTVPMGTGPADGLPTGHSVAFQLLLGGSTARTAQRSQVTARLVGVWLPEAGTDPLGELVEGKPIGILGMPELRLESDGPDGKLYSGDLKPGDQYVCYYAVGDIDGKRWISAPIWVSKAGLSADSAATTSPIFVLDRSGSMSGVQSQLQARAAELVEYLLGRVSRMAVINFEGRNAIAVDAPLTTDTQKIIRAIQNPSLGGGSTALWDAVVTAIDHAQKSNEKAMIVLLTDGGENSSRATLQETIRKAQRRGVPCLSVGFNCGGTEEESWLHNLADQTAGAFVRYENLDMDRFMAEYITFAKQNAQSVDQIKIVPIP
jgi:hypothetical protein